MEFVYGGNNDMGDSNFHGYDTIYILFNRQIKSNVTLNSIEKSKFSSEYDIELTVNFDLVTIVPPKHYYSKSERAYEMHNKKACAYFKGEGTTIVYSDIGVVHFYKDRGKVIVEAEFLKSNLEYVVNDIIVSELLPIAAFWCNSIILHSACLHKQGLTFALLGDGGAGKSTFTAALMKEKFSYISDDMIAIDIVKEVPHATYGGDEIKLWERSSLALGLNAIENTELSFAPGKFFFRASDITTIIRKPSPLTHLIQLRRFIGQQDKKAEFSSLSTINSYTLFLKSIVCGYALTPHQWKEIQKTGLELIKKLQCSLFEYPNGFHEFQESLHSFERILMSNTRIS